MLNARKKTLLLVLLLLIFLQIDCWRRSEKYLRSSDAPAVSWILEKIFKPQVERHNVEIDYEFEECPIESWNNVTTSEIPLQKLHDQWMADRMGAMPNLAESQLRVISAFVYKSEIVVTTTAQNRYGNKVYCRYFDCNRIEIPDSSFETHMFPMTAAYCARRAGAKFVGLTEKKHEECVDPVPVTFRAYDKPVHDVSVCVGPIYGKESRWLEIVETTEHHILLGIRYFYHTVFNDMDSYTRKLLDEYQRLGTAEVTIVQTEYETMDWMFHMIQINDCFFRARAHSKWILNVDIDERLVLSRMPLRSFLRSFPEDVGEITFSANRVMRTKELPERFQGEERLQKDLLFLNYDATSETMFKAMKALIRPDRTEAMFYHWTWRQHPGVRIQAVAKSVGYVRHYRTTLASLAQNWTKANLNFRSTRLNSRFEQKLWMAIWKRMRRVYAQRVIYCEELPQESLSWFSKDNYHCSWKNGTRFGET